VGDLAEVAARFGALLRAAGLPVGPQRCARFAEAMVLARPRTTSQLRWCARATLAGTPAEIRTLDRVFDAVFAGLTDPADHRGDAPDQSMAPPPASPPPDPPPPDPPPPDPPAPDPSILQLGTRTSPENPFMFTDPSARSTGEGDDGGGREVEYPSAASALERLAHRDFGDLSPDELALLRDAMSRVELATPPRRSRRTRRVPHAGRVDLRVALRHAGRTGGDPLRLVRRRPRVVRRRLVALCDISGSMAPYARALLQLLYCAAGVRAEVFVFATRLTRLTSVLTGASPEDALGRAGRAAPDWSGGTRIGAALKEFIDAHGRRGMARGAVLLIISDGWETGDPALLGHQMARLSRLAYRVVWVNPRTRSAQYRPLAGGMAAAWPYCDEVVSGHRLAALEDLARAVADPVRRRRLS